ncbi:coiled-coil domain-containing protein 73-like [Python bivittatus]|uniref:Coiled-coil domain-containing protein 73-like n=1 Tax=Python bivittatus TaxID=176946 RepID=A0A9F5MS09_PYTBI|nr:coiled-coil domain-containing protein 73-like [Python bivittatus]
MTKTDRNVAHSIENLDAGVANEYISESTENINNTIYEEDYLTNKGISKEFKQQIKITCEKTANNHLKSEMDSVLLQAINTVFHDGGLDKYDDTSKAEKTSPKHSMDCIPSSKNTGVNIHIDENINNLLLIRTLSTENSATDINEMPSKYFDKYSSKLKEVNTNKVLLLDPENIYESEIGDMKVNKVAKDKQKRFHTSKANSKQFIEFFNEEKVLLTERKKSLNTVMRKITVEESTKKSHSLLMKTTEDLINRNGRLSFDVPVMDEKTEYLNLSSVCEDGVQIMPFFLKESPLSQEVRTAQSSRKIDEAINMHIDVRQETPGKKVFKCFGTVKLYENKLQLLPFPLCRSVSACSSGIADSLNTGTINPIPERNPSEEWNAIAKSFYDPSFPTERVSQLKILQSRPYNTILPKLEQNGENCIHLQERGIGEYSAKIMAQKTAISFLCKIINVVPPSQRCLNAILLSKWSCFKFQNIRNGISKRLVTTEILSQPQMKSIQLLLSEVNTATVKGRLQSADEKDWNSQNVFMNTQISKTEKLLYLEKLCQSRKRKYEYLEKAVTSGKTEM